MVEVDDEDLAVADLTGLGGRGDGIDGLVDLIGRHRDLDLDLRKETHRVFSPTVDFRVALLPAVSLDFRHRQAVNADGGQRVTDFFQFEWLDDRHNDFHGFYPRLGPAFCGPGVISTEFTTRRKFATRPQPGGVESNAVPDFLPLLN